MARSLFLALAFLFAVATVLPVPADEPKADDGFKPLFNGKDLTGWLNVNCHPDTFFVKDGEIITTGQPPGFLRTEKHYENFELELEWMHENKVEVGNSGLFVWGDPLPAIGTPLRVMATWSVPGLAFAVYTAANLVPRALSHHDWYRQRFVDYPAGRRALIPYVL